MLRTDDGLIVLARRPCRTGCSHADEAWTPEELARERRRGRGPNRILSLDEEREVRAAFRPRGFHRSSNAEELAEAYGVTSRTIYRVVQRAANCPGADGRGCATKTPGGRLCAYCIRTKALSSRAHPEPVSAASVEL